MRYDEFRDMHKKDTYSKEDLIARIKHAGAFSMCGSGTMCSSCSHAGEPECYVCNEIDIDKLLAWLYKE